VTGSSGGRKIVNRYRDANEGRTAKYNILWSNVVTLIRRSTPEPDVTRRHQDNDDPAAGLGAEIVRSAHSLGRTTSWNLTASCRR
jgi:hypothetical protein